MASSDTLHWKRNLVLMWLSQLLILSGFAAVMPFIPLFLKDQLGIVAEGERGIYMSMFYFFGVLGYAMFFRSGARWRTVSACVRCCSAEPL